uniref:Transferase, transferring glycosyl groups n=1 Tax=Solanum tuberosum TaxID=4113 RepID=M1CEJ4_SOLTU
MSTTGDDWAGNCVLMIVGLYAIDRGLYSYRKYRKEKEQNVKKEQKRRSYESSLAYVLTTYAIWFMPFIWLFAPFLFNPSEFDWGKIVDDWKDWNKWINQQGGIGIQQDKSWQSWWNDEQAHLRHAGLFSRLIDILLSLRFFPYQYGLTGVSP